ncbi:MULTISPECIES: HpcH/HpaI aldolase/citrate lyase family protein [Achromobacter]|uniref:HpcH/HpaI aldolase/citrate lyase family protein n=1 Tax=Achromobacter TaxID=222 RepID=UPI001467C50E|nr:MULTISPECIES: CoA ester lyase [Achromobacter]CAB3822240.1 (3S)-malyl-CoA thioesterase [Achromobacter animicus]
MNAPIRPRRSVLYMPGANARALDKARTLDADALILDLEDAVAPDAKAQARAQVAAALREGGYGRRECIVRVNALDTPWGMDDVRAVAQAGADAVLLPKVESPAQLAALAQALDAAGAPEDLPLWAMAETPLGFLRLDAIAGGHARLAAIVVGTSDLVKDLHARHTPSRDETLLARSFAVMAARAHGLAVLDGVHLDLNDDAGLQDACRQGRDQGFDGKTLIHPRQIAAANAAFAPTAEELDTARKRLDAWRAAQAEGKGVAVVDGALVENLHASEAERVLALAAAIQTP